MTVLRRLRVGELLLLVGLAGLVASLFVRWFAFDLPGGDALQNMPCCAGLTPEGDTILSGSHGIGWGALGRPWLDVLAVAGLSWIVVLGLALRAGGGRPTYGAVVGVVVATLVTTIVLLLTVVRTLVARPDAAHEDAYALYGNIDRLRDLEAIPIGIGTGAWIGLGSLLVGLAGLWVAMADDRTHAAESAVPPPPAREVPPPRPVPATGLAAPDVPPAT